MTLKSGLVCDCFDSFRFSGFMLTFTRNWPGDCENTFASGNIEKWAVPEQWHAYILEKRRAFSCSGATAHDSPNRFAKVWVTVLWKFSSIPIPNKHRERHNGQGHNMGNTLLSNPVTVKVEQTGDEWVVLTNLWYSLSQLTSFSLQHCIQMGAILTPSKTKGDQEVIKFQVGTNQSMNLKWREKTRNQRSQKSGAFPTRQPVLPTNVKWSLQM